MSEVTKRSVHVLVTYLLVTGTYIHPLNGTLSGTTQVSRYQKGKTNLDFTGARDSEWQWHQLGHMQVGTSLQTDNHASTPPFSFFYRPDALSVAQPTASKHWRHLLLELHCVPKSEPPKHFATATANLHRFK